MNNEANMAILDSKAIIVGVDIAKDTHYARIIDMRGRTLKKSFPVKNNRASFDSLVESILNLTPGKNPELVIVGLESTGHYWKALKTYLTYGGIQVVQVNPYHVRLEKESYDNSQTKSDPKDAGIIADLVRNGRFTDTYEMEPVYEDLRELASAKLFHDKTASGHLCNIHAILDEHFPEFFQVFAGLESKGVLWLLNTCPFPEDVIKIGVQAIYEGLSEVSRGKFSFEKAVKLVKLAESSIGTKRGLRGTKSRLVSHLAGLEATRERLEVIEEEMIALLQETGLAEVLTSVPGIGSVSAAMFLSEVGDPRDYPDWRQIRRVAGLNLVHQSSGKKTGKTTISRRGRPLLRRILYFMAIAALRTQSSLKEYYLNLRFRKTNPLCGKAAVVALGCKIIRIICAVSKQLRPYTETLMSH